MKGVILAGGKGTRLMPATRVTNKHMLAVLNEPMIMYPLQTLKSFGITDILVVSGGNHIGHIAEFLGDGSEFGVSLTYRVQKEAGGIAEALGLARDFARYDPIMVILGDNVFAEFGGSTLQSVFTLPKDKACIFVKEVSDPRRFGVYSIEGIKEKPEHPDTNMAVTGLYVYPPEVFDVIKTLTPSGRGELEITDVNNHFLHAGKLVVCKVLDFWSDAGTPDSMVEVINWAHKK
jgi:glucose-1-phosphate thymidylyltransferase